MEDPNGWFVFLRIAVGLWWVESVRHKSRAAWLRGTGGIDWGISNARKHPWGFVQRTVPAIVEPRKQVMSRLLYFSELAVGLGLVLGFLTPVAAIGGLLLNAAYFLLMAPLNNWGEWAEQGQNSMMFAIELAVLFTGAGCRFGVDDALGIFC